MREQSSTGKARVVDPVLYARVIMALKDGRRPAAVQAVQEGLGLDAAEAEACVADLWRSYEEEIPATQVELATNSSSLLQMVAIVVIAALLGWIIWAKLIH